VAGAALAVAVIIPTVSLLDHTGGHHPSPAPAPTSPTTTRPVQLPPPGVLDVSSLPTGGTPRTEYVTDGTVLHRVTGDTVDVGTSHPVTAFVTLRDGARVFQTAGSGQTYVEVADASGVLHPPVTSMEGLVVDPDHRLAAWVDANGQVMVWSVGASQPKPLGDPISGSDVRIAGIDGYSCSLACEAYVNVTDAHGDRQPWFVSLSGSQPLHDGSYLTIADVAGGLDIGLDHLTDFGSCSKLQGGGELQGWSTCQHTLVSFAPGERLVLADPAYHDGIGNGVIAMYRTGNGDLLFQRHSTRNAQAFYNVAQWEDNGHVLAPVFQDGRWAIVRFASDGSMEYAVPPVDGSPLHSPFVVETT
jgi:hypothetical protein